MWNIIAMKEIRVCVCVCECLECVTTWSVERHLRVSCYREIRVFSAKWQLDRFELRISCGIFPFLKNGYHSIRNELKTEPTHESAGAKWKRETHTKYCVLRARASFPQFLGCSAIYSSSCITYHRNAQQHFHKTVQNTLLFTDIYYTRYQRIVMYSQIHAHTHTHTRWYIQIFGGVCIFTCGFEASRNEPLNQTREYNDMFIHINFNLLQIALVAPWKRISELSRYTIEYQ